MALPPGSTDHFPDGVCCPACGSTLERLHRHRLDRWISLFRTVHRYRCLRPACAWEGVLGRDEQVADEAAIAWRPRALWFGIGVALALASVAGVAWWRSKPPGLLPSQLAAAGEEARARAKPPGEDHPGAELPAEDARVVRNRTPLVLRHSCAWGVPGGNPYRGTVAQALTAAGLPSDVVRTISTMAERGAVTDQVEIGNTGIRTVDGRRELGNHIRAMGFGNTLCFNTRVNFQPGHVEYAALYEATDSRQRTYRVMVPYVCQNVSVLGQRGEIDDSQDVPEPPGWALVGLGLGLAAFARWQARRRRP